MANWTIVTSNKPRRQGEFFIQRNGVFVLKLYKDAVPNPAAFARWLTDQLNQSEERKRQTHETP